MSTAPRPSTHGNAACPCGAASPRGQALPYAQCCGRWLEGNTPAPDAQQLMRSRYTAFVLQRADYLRATWHASQRPATLVCEPGIKWLGLDIRRYAYDSAANPTHAEVEFVARFKPAAVPAVRQHERSRFVHQDGRWWYVDGVVL